MGATTIEWLRMYQADGTFSKGWSVNPIRARDRTTSAIGHYCELCSPGCGNCYASRFQPRFGLPMFAGEKQRDERLAQLELFLDEDVLNAVLRRKKPTRIFWEDMSDLFGPWVPGLFIDRCLETMALALQHIHLVLTKRPDRMRQHLLSRAFRGNAPRALWGVTICNQAEANQWRPEMQQLAVQRWPTWVSYEPALGPVDWTGWEFVKQIVGGGESGSGKTVHLCHPDWQRATRDFCVEHHIAYFFKQWGAWLPAGQDGSRIGRDQLLNCSDEPERVGKKAAGRLLDGREWNEMPAVTGSSSLVQESAR